MNFNPHLPHSGTRFSATAAPASDSNDDPDYLDRPSYDLDRTGDDVPATGSDAREGLSRFAAPYGKPSVAAFSRSTPGAPPSAALWLLHVGPCFMNGGSEQQLIALAKFLDPQRVRFERCLVTGRKHLDANLAARMPARVTWADADTIRRAVGQCDVLLTWGLALNDLLGTFSRLAPDKRVEVLIEAVARLPAAFKLLVAGWGDHRAALLEVANDRIPGRYAFTQAGDYLGDVYGAMDAFGLASAHEGFGLGVAEALLCGVPVVATRGEVQSLAQERLQPPVPGYEWSDQAVIKRTWPEFYSRVQLDYLSLIFQWFNESSANLAIEQTLEPRQEQLLRIVRPLGERLVGAEIGVYDDSTSAALLSGLPGLRLWMIGHWRPYEGESGLGALDQAAFDRARARAEWWTLPAADRRFVLRATSLEAAERFGPESLDFAFIDGYYRYEHDRADLHAWWPKIRAGGLLSGHDYDAARDATGPWGVRRAVDEFAANVRRTVQVGSDGVWWIER